MQKLRLAQAGNHLGQGRIEALFIFILEKLLSVSRWFGSQGLQLLSGHNSGRPFSLGIYALSSSFFASNITYCRVHEINETFVLYRVPRYLLFLELSILLLILWLSWAGLSR